MASFIKHERFDDVNYFLQQDYYFKSDSYDAPENKMVSFTWFNFYPKSFSIRNDRLQLKFLDLMATTHKERATRDDLNFQDFMQAEFVLYLRLYSQQIEGFFHNRWFPHSLLYSSLRTTSPSAFLIFARAQNEGYFSRIKKMLGVNNKEGLITSMQEYVKNHNNEIPRWKFESVNFDALMNIKNLCAKP